MDQAIKNQLSYFTHGTYQEMPIDDLESTIPPQVGALNSTQSVMMLQPAQAMFGPRSRLHFSHFMSHSSTDHRTSLNPGANYGEDFGTMVPSPSLQQPAFWPSTMPFQTRPPDNTISVQQDISPFALKHQVPLEYQEQHPPKTVRPPTRKRAPKTATMSAQKWAPAEGRIRQLFLDEEKGYKDLMETINTEFGFWANERQYKAKIKDMKLKRSVEAKDRITIVRRIQHRRHAIGKETGYVRVRGHRITESKLRRWEKEHPMPVPSQLLSPLPSEISLQTKSHLECPTLSLDATSSKNLQLAQSGAVNQNMDTPITRLLKHAHKLGTTMKSNQSSAIFNDFQQILSFDHGNVVQPNHPGFIKDVWSPAIEEDILRVRNWMNLKQEVWFGKESQEMIQPTSGSQIARRCGIRSTPYGRVLAVFSQVQNPPKHKSDSEELSAERSIAVKIAIHPSDIGSVPFRIVLDLDPRLNPFATITYQATIPNNSEIFKIIKFGKLEDLLKALEAKTASLTDRDEEGRSLLNYANQFKRVEFCRFLLDKNFDPDAIELSHGGFLTFVFAMQEGLTNETDPNYWHHRSECCKLMLEAGADFGTNIDGIPWTEGWQSGFDWAITSECCITLTNVIRYGQPFISPSTLVQICDGHWCSPLIYLAGHTDATSMHCLEKAIILLRWGVSISCQDLNGNNVLHTVLKDPRTSGYHEQMRVRAEPGELLKVFIAAGADVYALDSAGRSPSRVARNYGRKKEWLKALEFCGFDAREVWKYSMAKNKEYTRSRQTSKLSFEEYYQEWERIGKVKWEKRSDEVDSEDEEDSEEEYSEEEYSEEEYSEEEYSEEEEECEEEECSEKEGSSDEGHAEKCTHGSVDEKPGLSATGFKNMDCDGNNPTEIWGSDPHYIVPQDPTQNQIGTWEGMREEFADHTFIQMSQNANNTGISSEPYGPMLNDKAETMSAFSTFGDMNGTRPLDQTSVVNSNFFGDMGATVDDTFSTDFDVFMHSD